MYCPECRCEFIGWTARCPTCKTPLVEQAPPVPTATERPVSHEALVDLVRENGGQLSIDVSTTDVGSKRTWSFPYFGYGLAWAKRMQGVLDDVLVDLQTTEVGGEKGRGFPYVGYRYAWASRMQGHVGGNEVTLAVTKVAKEKRRSFPYFGYGFAWTQEMSGGCGDQLRVVLSSTDVGRRRARRFPYRGFGYAWANKATLTLTTNDEA